MIDSATPDAASDTTERYRLPRPTYRRFPENIKRGSASLSHLRRDLSPDMFLGVGDRPHCLARHVDGHPPASLPGDPE